MNTAVNVERFHVKYKFNIFPVFFIESNIYSRN